jgi:hypothetical protein
MEVRQNWHKFQRLLGPLPPKKSGLVVLHSHNRILAGALGLAAGSPSQSGFSDQGKQTDQLDTTWEVFSHKYNAAGATFLDNEELMNALSQVAAVRPTAPATDHFYAQLTRLREMIGVEKKAEPNSLATHVGERPVEQFWPRQNFLLTLFRSFFGELFPERKLLLLGVVNGARSLDTLLLEFQGPELKGFCEPDFSGMDWQGQDLFLPETAGRFVAWCESHYMLPAYSLFVSRRIWEECREAQMIHGEKAAWKLLQKTRSQRDVEKELLFEPEPWPVKALLRWHSMRG